MKKNDPQTTLKPWHKAILAQLDKPSGYPSRCIGEKVWPNMPRRTASQAARMHCEKLERLGLIKRLDSGKPIAWVLV